MDFIDMFKQTMDNFDSELKRYATEMISTYKLPKKEYKSLMNDVDMKTDYLVKQYGESLRHAIHTHQLAEALSHCISFTQAELLKSKDWYTKVQLAADSDGRLYIYNPTLDRVKEIAKSCIDLIDKKFRHDMGHPISDGNINSSR